MNNNTPKKKILQEVIDKKEINFLTEKYGYKDTDRKLTVHSLCQYYMVSAMNGTKSQRELAMQGVSHGLTRVDHTSISKKSKEVPYEIYLELCKNIIAKSNRAIRRKVTEKYNRIVKVIDSTRVIEPSLKWDWAPYKQGHSGIKLHVSRLSGSGMPSEIFVSEINECDSSNLVNFGDRVTLCTNIVDLYTTEIADLYRLRWSIETFFKTFKQNFQVKRLFGTSKNAVFSQAIIAFLVSTVFSVLFAVAKSNLLVKANVSFVCFVRSVKFDNLNFSLSDLILCIFF